MIISSTPALEGQPAINLYQQLMDVFIWPEIQRRQDAGTLAAEFRLRAAQLICYDDDRPNELRLNEEVRVRLQVKLRPGVEVNAGEAASNAQIERIEDLVLPKSEDPNCGHISLVRLGDGWFISFDFRYNRAKCASLAARATQFHRLAEAAVESPDRGPLVYNLFAAAELAAKAIFMASPDSGMAASKKHNALKSRLNMAAKLGNVSRASAEAFNVLLEERTSIYATSLVSMTDGEARDLVAKVGSLVDQAHGSLRD